MHERKNSFDEGINLLNALVYSRVGNSPSDELHFALFQSVSFAQVEHIESQIDRRLDTRRDFRGLNGSLLRRGKYVIKSDMSKAILQTFRLLFAMII